jgi:tripartite-type tricarboxylate transporter receptor subunit TctC
MITRRSMIAAGAVLLAAPAVKAQGTWPDKPLRFVIGGAAGGVSDIILRMMENRLRERLGQPMIIDPRPGAGGMVGAEVAARAAPDGYTLLRQSHRLTWDWADALSAAFF